MFSPIEVCICFTVHRHLSDDIDATGVSGVKSLNPESFPRQPCIYQTFTQRSMRDKDTLKMNTGAKRCKIADMDTSAKHSSALFDVLLRLRPSPASRDRFLDVEDEEAGQSSHITIRPPENDFRKRAVEKFAFTKVFSEEASQLDVFHGSGVLPLIEGVLGADGRPSKDGLLATLGVTGSGKVLHNLGS